MMTLGARAFARYQRVQKGQIVENDGTVIPDCYIRNNALLDEIETHRMEADMQVSTNSAPSPTSANNILWRRHPAGFITLTCAEQRRPRYQAKIAQKADKESGKLKKERDYHRLAHRRVQEENKELQREIARLHQHYEGVEEHNSELQGKYESVKRTFACYFPSRITLPASPCSPLSRLLVAPFPRYPPS